MVQVRSETCLLLVCLAWLTCITASDVDQIAEDAAERALEEFLKGAAQCADVDQCGIDSSAFEPEIDDIIPPDVDEKLNGVIPDGVADTAKASGGWFSFLQRKKEKSIEEAVPLNGTREVTDEMLSKDSTTEATNSTEEEAKAAQGEEEAMVAEDEPPPIPRNKGKTISQRLAALVGLAGLLGLVYMSSKSGW